MTAFAGVLECTARVLRQLQRSDVTSHGLWCPRHVRERRGCSDDVTSVQSFTAVSVDCIGTFVFFIIARIVADSASALNHGTSAYPMVTVHHQRIITHADHCWK